MIGRTCLGLDQRHKVLKFHTRIDLDGERLTKVIDQCQLHFVSTSLRKKETENIQARQIAKWEKETKMDADGGADNVGVSAVLLEDPEFPSCLRVNQSHVVNRIACLGYRGRRRDGCMDEKVVGEPRFDFDFGG